MMQKCEIILGGISTAIQPFAKTTPFDTTSIAATIDACRLARSYCISVVLRLAFGWELYFLPIAIAVFQCISDDCKALL